MKTDSWLKLAKPVVFIAALVPLTLLVYNVLTGHTSANPAEDIQLTTGIWTFRFLLATLTITPMRRLTGWNRIIQFRRMLGLFAFFYGSVHLLSYLAFDRSFAFGEVLGDIVETTVYYGRHGGVCLDGAPGGDFDQGVDPQARATVADPAPPDLSERGRRGPALRLEGKGRDRGARLLCGRVSRPSWISPHLAVPPGVSSAVPTARSPPIGPV